MEPKVRFKGFKGEWDKQNASDLFLTIDERNRPELPVLSACQDVRGMIPRDKIGFNVSHDTSNEVTYKRVQPGQFVIHLRSFQGGFAHSSYDGIISPAYTVFDFKNKEQHDDYYWKIVFMSRPFIDRLRLITYGIRDGRSISFNEFKELSFQFPSKEEQQAIASFFCYLEAKIQASTKKVESLKKLKSASLVAMFPQNGESTPKVRFEGFEGEWKRHTLYDVLKINSGKDYKHLESGNIPVYGTGGYMLSVNDSLSNLDAIGIGRKGTIDKPQYLKAPFWTVDTLFFLTKKNNDDLFFLYNLVQNINWQKYDESTGVPSLSKNNMERVEIHMPNLAEQQAIATFFRSLDRKIALETARLEKLKQIKLACLDKMFV